MFDVQRRNFTPRNLQAPTSADIVAGTADSDVDWIANRSDQVLLKHPP